MRDSKVLPDLRVLTLRGLGGVNGKKTLKEEMVADEVTGGWGVGMQKPGATIEGRWLRYQS